MIYLKLFLGFLRIGCFSFGGAYGAIALIRDVVISNGWLNDEMFAYVIAVSESSPGPIMVNLATYVGSREAGIGGAVIATVGVVLPSFVVILIVTAVLKTLLKNVYVQAVLRGLKPCIVGMVLATGIHLTVRSILVPAENVALDPRAVVIALFLGFLMFGSQPLLNKKLSPIMLLLISAVCGIAAYGI